jgi:hypothetical protein
MCACARSVSVVRTVAVLPAAPGSPSAVDVVAGRVVAGCLSRLREPELRQGRTCVRVLAALAAGTDPLTAYVGRTVLPPLLADCVRAGGGVRQALLLDAAAAVVCGARKLSSADAGTPGTGIATQAQWRCRRTHPTHSVVPSLARSQTCTHAQFYICTHTYKHTCTHSHTHRYILIEPPHSLTHSVTHTHSLSVCLTRARVRCALCRGCGRWNAGGGAAGVVGRRIAWLCGRSIE